MTEPELEALFDTLAKRYGISPIGSKQIFTLLVKITLKYRDMLVRTGEKSLTVEETREALDELLKVMQVKKFSTHISNRIRQLVTLWHDELKVYLYH